MPKKAIAPPASPSLTTKRLAEMRDAFAACPRYVRTQNAVTQTTVDDIALNRSVVTSIDHTFSTVLDDWGATSQKASGRCWMFAGLNLLRAGAMAKMKVKNFEFSQNHTLFWDKIERANHFLERVIATIDLDVDDRGLAFLLKDPIGDGGQWNMFVNVIRKHGVVPKAAMPESQSSSATGKMNGILKEKLREGAKTLRDLRAGGADIKALRVAKHEIVGVIYRILSIHLGTPPEKFTWQWRDKKRVFHRDTNMTPHKFAKKYITIPFEDYVCIVHDPRPENPRNRTYTVEHLGNVVGGEIVKYLNVEIDVMKKLAMKAIVGGEPVWFGCDVGKQMRGDIGIWDAEMFDYPGVYDTEFGLDKASRLIYHQTLMTHAMLFTGVDVVGGKPRRWRVENSWGKERGAKGFYAMNDSWFDEYMFEIAVRKSALPPKLRKALDRKPKVLPAWDPMGSLAG